MGSRRERAAEVSIHCEVVHLETGTGPKEWDRVDALVPPARLPGVFSGQFGRPVTARRRREIMATPRRGIPSLSVSALEHFMTVTLFAPQARGLVFLPELEESPRGAGLGQGATGGCLLLTGRSGQDEAAAWGNGGMGC